ncbi:MAG: RHS repeat-associated core domain-containing protein [Paludibacteraceae bacterium]|nr:RHS repeat-associated core domain-containing protein [Paludibacteraceae bacterium]
MMRKMQGDIRLYHVDHLGSTSLVTDIDGEITQHVVYIPYGEVFVEQRNGSWSTPYLFNAKELDEETGLYYYGARYLNPKDTRWLSVDPMFEKGMGMSPYTYCFGNPVRLQDPDGEWPWGDWPGVTYVYGEAKIQAGVVAGVGLLVQRGVAYDEYGHTHFTMSQFVHFNNQGITDSDGSIPHTVIFGAGAGLALGINHDWSSDSFHESINKPGQIGVNVLPISVGFNKNSFSISGGIDCELSIQHYGRMQISESISLTDQESYKMDGDVWTVKYKNNMYGGAKKLRDQGFAFKGKVCTGINGANESSVMVYCKADADGNPDNRWMSEAYIDAMNSDK